MNSTTHRANRQQIGLPPIKSRRQFSDFFPNQLHCLEWRHMTGARSLEPLGIFSEGQLSDFAKGTSWPKRCEGSPKVCPAEPTMRILNRCRRSFQNLIRNPEVGTGGPQVLLKRTLLSLRRSR